MHRFVARHPHLLLLTACQQAAAPSVQVPVPPTTLPTAAPTVEPAPTTEPVASPAPAVAAAETGEMITKMVDLTSQALAGNLLGDPSTRSLVVLLSPVAQNPHNPPFYEDTPWIIVDGKVQKVPEVVAKMDANDPIDDAKRYVEQPLRLKAFMVYHGKQDPTAPVQAARAFDKVLNDPDIPHDPVEVDNSQHCGIDFTPVVTYMSEHLASQAP